VYSASLRAGVIRATIPALVSVIIRRASLIRRTFHPFPLAALCELAVVAMVALLCGAGVSGQTHPRAQTHAVANSDGAASPVKSLGNKNAPITMEVFSDYQCPSCGNFYENTLKYMIQDSVAGGQVYFVHRDFPLPMHPYSYMAARWSNAAAKIGKFEVVDGALFDNQAAWSADGNIEKFVAAAVGPADFKRIKKLMEGCDVNPNVGVKPAAFNNIGQADHGCLLDSYIEQDKQLAKQIPVTQTPTSVITYKGQRYPAMPGFVTWPILKQFFNSLLSQ
jgi:protein-disulfide isomerase